MIISEKQIMQLMNVARSHSEQLRASGEWVKCLAYNIDQLLVSIQDQQSEELKDYSKINTVDYSGHLKNE